MNKTLTAILIAVFAVAISVPAFAAVQNVKVTGDILTRGIIKGNNNLNPDRDAAALIQGNHNVAAVNDLNANAHTLPNGSPYPRYFSSRDSMAPSDFSNDTGGATESIFMTTTKVGISADLTDNVSTVVELYNQRDWTNPGANTTDINVGQAYVKIKEMLYAPLTVSVGRQPLWFGKGFIVGSNDLVFADPDLSLSAPEFGVNTAFDAIRATLDYNPLTVDLVYSMINNPVSNRNDDVFLTGINAGYKLGMWNAEVEGYYWYYQDGRYKYTDPADVNNNFIVTDRPTIGSVPDDQIHIIGGRGSAEPIENLNVTAEIAWQGGKSWTVKDYDRRAYFSVDRNAMAIDTSIDYKFVNVKYTPKVGFEYILYTGAESRGLTGEPNGEDTGWHPIFRGKYDTLIREFQGGLLPGKNVIYGVYTLDDVDAPPAYQNEHQFALYGALQPLNDIKIDARWTYFITHTDVKYVNARTGTLDTRNSYLGNELDMKVSYNYTEDVTVGVVGGIFFPGSFFQHGDQFGPTDEPYNRRGDENAYTLIGSLSVVF